MLRRREAEPEDSYVPEHPTRCAIYTRVSTDEGLSQEFNSLDAQREAAEAYIRSQRHEGWVALPESYNDGGFSGGTMDRPALKRLLADIEAGSIDCVIVYKVDRLSRSLLDFARIVATFEEHGVSFVSVTQQFNTTASLGRLTLNILLSFAQFEREIIAERTRDKMCAARRKGKWIGGHPVLGYDVDPQGGKLVVNEDEAQRVRTIFELYLKHQSLMSVVEELNHRGWTTKRWITKKGVERGGLPLNKDIVFRILSNVTYTGRVNHKGDIYPGEHPAIVERELWEKVNGLLRQNGVSGGQQIRNRHGALLRGLLHCEPCGTAMTHTFTAKNGRRYRYYVCTSAQKQGWDSCPSKSLPAAEIEEFVVDRVREIGKDPEIIAETFHEAQRQSRSESADLRSELTTLERKLRRLTNDTAKLLAAPGPRNGHRTDRMADLQDQILAAEARATEIQKELAALPADQISEADVAAALRDFDPVWKGLTTDERCRIIRTLIERVGYDGRTGKVAISFRSEGFKALCEGAGEKE